MGTGIITRDFFLKFYLFIAKGASYHGVTSLNVGLETKLSQVNEHIAPSVRTCRGSIYRTRNDGRHKCRPYKDLKWDFLYYLIKKVKLEEK